MKINLLEFEGQINTNEFMSGYWLQTVEGVFEYKDIPPF